MSWGSADLTLKEIFKLGDHKLTLSRASVTEDLKTRDPP